MDTYPIIEPLDEPSFFYTDLSEIMGASGEVETASENQGLRYIKGQVIITGDRGEIEQAKNKLDTQFGELTGPSPELELDNTGRIIGRYSLVPKGRVKQFVEAFNKQVEQDLDPGLTDDERRKAPFAELNYIVRQPRGPGTEGDPEDPGVVGDPFTLPAEMQVTVDDFLHQWAFSEENGIRLNRIFNYDTKEYMPESGKDVRILVFDSSPLATGDYTVKLGDQYSYELKVSALIDDELKKQNGAKVEKDLLDSHGLFVANLAHAVAPHSSIHLVQVLECDKGKKLLRGDLFTLLNALHLCLQDPLVPDKIVVNLSLGFDMDFDLIGEEFNALAFPRVSMRSRKMGESEHRVPIRCFHQIWKAPKLRTRREERNLVFVAAAGNDSKNKPQPPGTEPEVLGVAALNYFGGKAPFSNSGEVGAPGGGRREEVREAGGRIELKLEKICEENRNCPYGLMSIVKIKDDCSYAYWAGTSFAAPLVSGIVATGLAVNPDVNAFLEQIENPIKKDELVTLDNALPQNRP